MLKSRKLHSVAIPHLKGSQRVTEALLPDEDWAFKTIRPLWTGCGSWQEKALLVEKILGSFLLEIPRGDQGSYANSILRFLTTFLEIDRDSEIVCVEQAAFLRISSHESWRLAASRWLSEFGADATERWAEPFPAYTIMAMHHMSRPDYVGFR